jgi:hypothetical protein
VKFLKCVNLNVSLQVPFCYKRLRTLVATVGSLASVNSYEMLRQARRLSKGLCTMGAAKTFLKNVNSYRSLQDTFVTNDSVHWAHLKSFSPVRTVIWFLKVRKLSISNLLPDSLLISPQLPSLQHLHQIYKPEKKF